MNIELMQKIVGEWMREDTGYYYTFKNEKHYTSNCWQLSVQETPVSRVSSFSFKIETEGGVDYLYVDDKKFTLITVSAEEFLITIPVGDTRRFIPAPYDYMTWPRPKVPKLNNPSEA